MPSVRKCLVTIVLMSVACFTGAVSGQTGTTSGQTHPSNSEGLAAWQQIYSVLTHPRCLNCHTATNYPEQGEDRHRHQFNVVRGPEGRGVPGLTCGTCHQGATSKATGGPSCAECHKGADLSATGVPGGTGPYDINFFKGAQKLGFQNWKGFERLPRKFTWYENYRKFSHCLREAA